MKILIAEDDSVSRKLLLANLDRWGFETVPTEDGQAAWERLRSDDALRLAVLDIMMPKMDGLEICRRARKELTGRPLFILLLTAKGRKEDVVEGLMAGADDYVSKPFHPEELKARIGVGARLLGLQESLARRVRDLEAAMEQVRTLEGIIPICSYCKKIRDEADSWGALEAYIQAHSHARFSHGICPDCVETAKKQMGLQE